MYYAALQVTTLPTYFISEAAISDEVKVTNFLAKYRAQPYYCGEIFSKTPSKLHSPFFPNLYPLKARCVWGFQANAHEVVRLTFNSFDVEHHPRCRYVAAMLSKGQLIISDICNININKTPTIVITIVNGTFIDQRNEI